MNDDDMGLTQQGESPVGSGEGASSGSGGATANAGVMGIGSSINSIMSALGNRRHNRKMARDQRAWDYRMWNEQNVYNSPIEQRKRLLAGGYNPQLALGNINQSAGLVHSSPTSTQGASIDLSGAMAQYGDPVMRAKTLESMDAQIAATKQQAAMNGVKTTHEVVKEARSTADLTQATALYNTAIDRARQEYDNSVGTGKKIEAEIDKLNIEKAQLPKKYEQEMRESAQRIRNMKGQATYQEIENQIKSEVARWQRLGLTPDQQASALSNLFNLLKR